MIVQNRLDSLIRVEVRRVCCMRMECMVWVLDSSWTSASSKSLIRVEDYSWLNKNIFFLLFENWQYFFIKSRNYFRYFRIQILSVRNCSLWFSLSTIRLFGTERTPSTQRNWKLSQKCYLLKNGAQSLSICSKLSCLIYFKLILQKHFFWLICYTGCPKESIDKYKKSYIFQRF